MSHVTDRRKRSSSVSLNSLEHLSVRGEVARHEMVVESVGVVGAI